MVLFKVNNVDFTARVNHQKSYAVQSNDVYTTWTDGNYVDHRVVARQRISGSFTMTFTSDAQFDAFTAALAAVKHVDGYYPVQVWDNKSKTLVSINAFIDYTPQHRWTEASFGQTPELTAVSVKISQR